jgi:WASH complex subunit strumpellin
MDTLKSEDNLCGQTLLRLSASGSSILAELSRLAQNIPDVFKGENQFTPILFDFAYLKNSEEAERRLNATTGMLDLDQEFIDSFGPIIMRFYGLFESIVTFLEEYLEFIQNLNSGIFIQYTTESVLQDVHGKQLMCECLYLYGVMLLMLERHIPGLVRERMVIAVMRHQPEASLEKVEDVCKLIRSTGYLGHGSPVDKYPKDYPEKYFARFPIDKRLVKMIIQTLQSDDIYKGAESFPSPEHRSTRLATQAGMMYVILYFVPELLKSGDAAMREAVDKHFSDGSTSFWIISVHMGHTVDLSAQWKGYESAKKALNNILTTENVTKAAEQNLRWFHEAKEELTGYLDEGVLNEQFVLLHLQKLVECMRKANVALRWRLLHRKCSQPKFRAFIQGQVEEKGVIDLLLQSAQLEFRVKNIVTGLLEKKGEQWVECRALCAGRLRELSDYFTGSKALTRVKKDDRMMQWFASVAAEVEAMNDGTEDSAAGGATLFFLICVCHVYVCHVCVTAHISFLADPASLPHPYYISLSLFLTPLHPSFQTTTTTDKQAGLLGGSTPRCSGARSRRPSWRWRRWSSSTRSTPMCRSSSSWRTRGSCCGR